MSTALSLGDERPIEVLKKWKRHNQICLIGKISLEMVVKFLLFCLHSKATSWLKLNIFDKHNCTLSGRGRRKIEGDMKCDGWR